MKKGILDELVEKRIKEEKEISRQEGFYAGLNTASEFMHIHLIQGDYEDLNEQARKYAYDCIKQKMVEDVAKLFISYNKLYKDTVKSLLRDFSIQNQFEYKDPVNIYEHKNAEEEKKRCDDITNAGNMAAVIACLG